MPIGDNGKVPKSIHSCINQNRINLGLRGPDGKTIDCGCVACFAEKQYQGQVDYGVPDPFGDHERYTKGILRSGTDWLSQPNRYVQAVEVLSALNRDREVELLQREKEKAARMNTNLNPGLKK